MTYMDRDYIKERSVIECYLQGKLSPDDQVAFEEAYLADPELLDQLDRANRLQEEFELPERVREQIDLAERLREGLRTLDETNELSRQQGVSWRSAYFSPRYAVAASILLAVSLVLSGTLYREMLALRESPGPDWGAPLTRLVPLVTVRGATVNTVAAPNENEQIVFLVDPGFSDHEVFRARVSRINPPETVIEFPGLQLGYENYLAVAVPGALLLPGDYEVVIEGRVAGSGDASFEETNRLGVTVEARDTP